MTVRSIKLIVDSSFASTALVRAALRGLCDYMGIGGPVLDCIELAVSEAVNNCVEHAYVGQAGFEILVECSLHPGHLEVVVSDTGKAMASHYLDEANSDMLEIDPDHPDGLRARGRGLALIKESMDGVEYRSDGKNNRLVMTKAVAEKDG